MTISGKIYSIGNYAGDVLNGVIEVPTTVGTVAAAAGATVTGVLGTAASILCVGKTEKFNQTATHAKAARIIVPLLFRRIAHIVNKTSDALPMKKMTEVDVITRKRTVSYVPTNEISYGPFRYSWDLFESARMFATDGKLVKLDGEPTSVLKNHLLSRITYLVAGLVAVVARVFDAVAGVFLGLGVLVYSLFAKEVNPDMLITIDQCLSFNVVDDVCRAVRGFVNPVQTHLVDDYTMLDKVSKIITEKHDGVDDV